MSLPQRFLDWFSARGWTPRPHQLAVLRHAEARQSVLLISPTGGGKTLAGVLPSLAEITQGGQAGGIHTLYVSPLKALAVDTCAIIPPTWMFLWPSMSRDCTAIGVHRQAWLASSRRLAQQ